MRFNEYNADNTKSGKLMASSPSVIKRLTVTRRGLFRLNRAASGFFGLAQGDRIAFRQDADYPSDWYIVKAKNGFPLETQTRKLGAVAASWLYFYSSDLAGKVIGSLGAQAENAGRVTLPLCEKNGMIAVCSAKAKFPGGYGQRSKSPVSKDL